MKHVTALIASLIVTAPIATTAMAQDLPVITIRPYGDSRIGDGAYVGPYGRDLPGVYMFQRSSPGTTPVFADGGVKVPTYQRIENELTYSQSELPILDAWHGTLSPGIPF
jgi:hypothetical protein